MPTIQITEYTDPACPFAWSAEPSRRRIEWLYGDQVEISPRMVGLSEDTEEMARKGLTPAMLARGSAHLAAAHHMPIDTSERPRLAASVPACRAVVAVRLQAPEQERAMLRALRVLSFAGELLDDDLTLGHAAERASVDPGELERWLAEPETEAALRQDMAAARAPSPEAVALPGKLATEGSSDTGYRYTCPSWELVHDGRTASVPGFQPTAAYEVAIANLLRSSPVARTRATSPRCCAGRASRWRPPRSPSSAGSGSPTPVSSSGASPSRSTSAPTGCGH